MSGHESDENAQSASESAYRAIRSGIIEGRYPPGSPLPESVIAESIGVSRTPVREAMRRLGAEGFVVLTRNRGGTVRPLTVEDISEILELRARLEGLAARLAAERSTQEDIESLTKLSLLIREHSSLKNPDSIDIMVDSNVAFHRQLVRAAHSHWLEASIGGLLELPISHRAFSLYDKIDRDRSLAHHDRLIDALRSRDPDWAEAVILTHVWAARRVLRAAVDLSSLNLGN